MLPLVKKVRLKSRIVAGFVIAGTVSVIVLGASWVNNHRISQRFGQFAELNRRAQSEFRIAQMLSEIQASTQVFTLQGQKSAALDVHRKVDLLKQMLADNRRVPGGGAGPRLNRIASHLDAYLKTFELVERQRARRTELVERDLFEAAAAAETTITNLKPSAGLDPDAAVRELLRAQRSARRYLEGLDAANVRAAKASIGKARVALGGPAPPTALHVGAADSRVAGTPAEAVRRLNTYEARFLEAVQRTRGYLYLVNVVMAAEASEVRYAARNLERINAVRVADEVVAFEADVRRTATITTSMVIVAMLVLLAFSIALLRSITEPIEGLSKTFRELARGSQDTAIAPYPVDDEIGELSAAASVFRSRNIETERLLDQSRALTRELGRNEKELRESNEELEQFVYTVSHDLKSPLVTSMGFIAIAKRLAARGDVAGAVAKLDRIVHANERMGQLINDLLELSRVGRVDIDLTQVDLSKMLGDLSASMQPQLQASGLELTVLGPLPCIWGNEGRVLQVFENLLGNAMKYARAPAGRSIEIGAKSDAEHDSVYIRDDGPGVDPAYHEKIFGLFQRLAKEEPGTGIGLTVVRKIMRFHGGDSWVESNSDGGATFWLRFPRRRPEQVGPDDG